MHGCNGKMGKVICDLVNKDADCAEVMKKAQNDFQVTYLDKETN